MSDPLSNPLSNPLTSDHVIPQGSDSYQRAVGVLWRDTGSRVVALARTSGRRVVVLGGSSAQLWRLLERPLSITELVDAFVDEDGARPAPQQVGDAIHQLLECGVVQRHDGITA